MYCEERTYTPMARRRLLCDFECYERDSTRLTDGHSLDDEQSSV